MSERPATEVGIIAADERSAAFFEAAARDVLLIKRCAGCSRWLEPSAMGCARCGEADPPWEPAAGRGALVSWAVVHAGAGAAHAAGVLALVELDEGPWLRTRLEGADREGPAAPRAGLRVAATFVHPADGESYPVFRPETPAEVSP
jgi:uncharacterized OB-fold protein